MFSITMKTFLHCYSSNCNKMKFEYSIKNKNNREESNSIRWFWPHVKTFAHYGEN